MADLYTNGALDYEKTARAIDGLKGVGNQGVRAAELQLITAAAVLDIAVSLGALIQGLANGGIWPDAPGVDSDDLADEPETDRPLEVGDWAAPRNAAGSALPGFEPMLVVALGTSEGDDWAELGEVEGQRAWVSNLVRVEPPRADEPDTDFVEPANPADLVDDIDSDFDEATVSAPRAGKKGKAKRGKQ